MSDCQYFSKCTFFADKMGNMPATANVFKRQFCQGTPENCARHMIWKARGEDAIPESLFPNERIKAGQLINQAATATA